jgi:hypothetical protein
MGAAAASSHLGKQFETEKAAEVSYVQEGVRVVMLQNKRKNWGEKI